MDLFDENITTEFVSDITNDFIEKQREIEGYRYNMFQTTIVKDDIEYYCERVNIESERNVNGIHGLFFSNNNNNQTRFEGTEIDTEDPRLFICNNKIYVIFNAVSEGKRCMAISDYHDFNPVFLRIGDENGNEEDREHRIEKNWSPCIVNNELYLIYALDPLIVLHFNFNNEGKCDIIYKQNPEISIQKISMSDKCLRGSSCFIPYSNDLNLYIGLNHSYICKNDHHYYFAYLCILDVTNWKIQYISKPIACRSLLSDSISKYTDTDIIMNSARYYYKDTYYTNHMHHIDITIVYPTSIYSLKNNDEYMIILNLNKYSLKNKMTIDFVAIQKKIEERKIEEERGEQISWDTIIRNYSMKLLE